MGLSPQRLRKNIKNSFFLPINESKTANQRTQLDTTYRETDYSSSTKKEEQATLKHTHQRLNQQCGIEKNFNENFATSTRTYCNCPTRPVNKQTSKKRKKKRDAFPKHKRNARLAKATQWAPSRPPAERAGRQGDEEEVT